MDAPANNFFLKSNIKNVAGKPYYSTKDPIGKDTTQTGRDFLCFLLRKIREVRS